MLKSGILEDGLVSATDEETPQGSILSPLLSSIYLHYVLDLRFSDRARKARCYLRKGEMIRQVRIRVLGHLKKTPG
jgi:retron-type reverse transcriptase